MGSVPTRTPHHLNAHIQLLLNVSEAKTVVVSKQCLLSTLRQELPEGRSLKLSEVRPLRGQDQPGAESMHLPAPHAEK